MHNNKLQLNPDKTEMILITSKHNQESLSLPFSVDLNGSSIHLSSTVRNLGVTLDPRILSFYFIYLFFNFLSLFYQQVDKACFERMSA